MRRYPRGKQLQTDGHLEMEVTKSAPSLSCPAALPRKGPSPTVYPLMLITYAPDHDSRRQLP